METTRLQQVMEGYLKSYLVSEDWSSRVRARSLGLENDALGGMYEEVLKVPVKEKVYQRRRWEDEGNGGGGGDDDSSSGRNDSTDSSTSGRSSNASVSPSMRRMRRQEQEGDVYDDLEVVEPMIRRVA